MDVPRSPDMLQPFVPGATWSIAEVERDTGLGKDTLRVWERRYGFPVPSRDAFGERAYPPDQVQRLRLIKRLLDAGHRPGKVVSLSEPELAALMREAQIGAVQRAEEQGIGLWDESIKELIALQELPDLGEKEAKEVEILLNYTQLRKTS